MIECQTRRGDRGQEESLYNSISCILGKKIIRAIGCPGEIWGWNLMNAGQNEVGSLMGLSSGQVSSIRKA